MSAPPTNNSTFVCDCAERMRSACRGEEFFKQSGEKRYCVLHYPGEEKAEQFSTALDRRLKAKKLDFSGVWFPEVTFSGQTLNKASFKEATFSSLANFSQTIFNEYVDFRQAVFGERADFRSAIVADGRFQYAEFVIADFTEAHFKIANFLESVFQQANFVDAHFDGDAFFNPIRVSESTNFRNATFMGKAYFGKAVLKAAYFGEAKFANVVDFGEAQFSNSNFEKARFGDRANFGGAQFSDDVGFKGTVFKDADFKKAHFIGNAHFDDAEFLDEARFEETILTEDVVFDRAEFGKQAYFYRTKFIPKVSHVNQTGASLEPILGENPRTVSFDSARFKDTLVFEGCELINTRLHLDSATAEEPARITFSSINLRPIWLSRFDSRSVQFIKVRWRDLRRRKVISAELKTLQQENVDTPYESLEVVCRQLAVNAEENNRYEEAARFRFIANEARRRESWYNLRSEPNKLDSWIHFNPLLWFYGGVSGYGERPWQAAGVLLVACVLFAAVFYFGQGTGQWWQSPKNSPPIASPSPQKTESKDQSLEKLDSKADSREENDSKTQSAENGNDKSKPPMLHDFREALLYSANVIALQKPEPLPANKRAKVLVLMETLFGPLQLALLALAIRRRFMR
ncbi:MAG: pentapeptide repeat-containing protein [Acidobacteriota bacterium]